MKRISVFLIAALVGLATNKAHALATPTNTPVATATRTNTPVVSATATRTITLTRTPTRTITLTRTPSPTSTFTPTVSPTFTRTPTRTYTPFNTPTETPVPGSPTATKTPGIRFGGNIGYPLVYMDVDGALVIKSILTDVYGEPVGTASKPLFYQIVTPVP